MYEGISTLTSHYNTYFSHSNTNNIGGTNHYRSEIAHPYKTITDDLIID